MRPAVRAAAARLRIDSATADVLRAFDAAGVQSILLKGAGNRQWLGKVGGDRAPADCDLLVRPRDGGLAARVLSGLGFVSELDVTQMPDWWREHAVAWTREDDLATIDAHRTLPGVGVNDRRAWELLSAGAEQIIVGGQPASVPPPPARAMLLALHAAHHGPGTPHVLSDLERGLQRANQGTWREAARLAQQLGALDAFLAGLRLLPAGRALADQMGIEATTSVAVALLGHGDSSRAPALTLERFTRARDLHTRCSILRYKLFPPPTFMRRWTPLAHRGRTGLIVAYVWRPVWVVYRLPAAVRVWRRAKTAVSGAKDPDF